MGINMNSKFESIFPLVSIIISTKEEGKNISNCLISIKQQSYKNIEIVVVDNGSIDKTKEIAKKYTHNVYNFGPERSAQRNYGIKKSKGEYVMYLDADMILEKNLIEECVKQIQDADALNIPEYILGGSFFSRCRNFERSFYCNSLIDGVRFMRKKIFKEVNGFDETFIGPEDWDLSKKIKQKRGKISLLKNSHINHNESEVVLKDYLNKKSYYSKSFDKYIKKWGADDKDVKKQLGFYYRFIGVFTKQGKYKKLLRHPLLTLGMYYLRFRVGLRYLRRNRNGC